METENIFILKGMEIYPKSNEDWEKEKEIFNLELPNDKKLSLEEYIKFKKGFGGVHDYVITDYNHAYFIDENNAIEAAIDDMGGLNDGGIYDYAAIVEVPCGVSYPETGEIVSFHLFKYNYAKRIYEELFIGPEYDVCKKYFFVMD